MNEKDKVEQKGMLDALRSTAKMAGLPEMFLFDLLVEDDDWAFVVKAHALLESVVCSLLATHLREPELERVLAGKVEMEARIEMLKALKLVDDADRRMMRTLSRLRNDLVHNAHQTSFKFSNYFENKDVKSNFVNTFALSWPDPIPGPNSMPRSEFILRAPTYAIWISVLGIVSLTADKKAQAIIAEENQKALIALLNSKTD